jgi:VCBS repeat-containing protein
MSEQRGRNGSTFLDNGLTDIGTTDAARARASATPASANQVALGDVATPQPTHTALAAHAAQSESFSASFSHHDVVDNGRQTGNAAFDVTANHSGHQADDDLSFAPNGAVDSGASDTVVAAGDVSHERGAFDDGQHSLGSDGFHAPPPAAVVYGQLWYGGQGSDGGTSSGSSDNQVGHIDSDTAGRDVSDVDTQDSDAGFESIGLDTSAGMYFALDGAGLLRSGHITNDTETNENSQFGTTISSQTGTEIQLTDDANEDEDNAIAIDPVHHIIYTEIWGKDDDTTAIIKISYNPTTGVMTSPYNSSTGTLTAGSNVLITNNTTSGKLVDVTAMSYDVASGNLYYIDDSFGQSFNFGANQVWNASRNIYVVNTTSGALTQLTTGQNAADTNSYIAGFAVDEAKGIIYYSIDTVSTHSTAFFWMPITGGAGTAMSIPGGVTLGFEGYFKNGSNAMAIDQNNQQLYIGDSSDSHVVQLTLSADGHSFVSGNSNYEIFDGNGNSSYTGALQFDDQATLGSLSTTSTEVVQGGGATTLLTGAPTIADKDGIHLGFVQVVISNAQAGDVLSATASGGITVSYNSTTHTLTLSGDASFAAYQTVMDSVQFQDTGTDNSTGSHPTRTIDWIVSDGTTLVDQTTASANEQAETVVIDRAPTLGADSYSFVLESGTQTGTAGTGGTGVLGNDNDKDGDAIVVTAVNGSGANLNNSVNGTYGALQLFSDGHFTYSANNTSAIDSAATGSHPVDTFTYTVSDGLGGVTTTTVSFTIDRAPTVTSDSGAAVESASGTGNVLTNDSDKDGDSITVTAVNGNTLNVGNSVAGTYGSITIAANGGYTYNASNTSAIDSAATGAHLTDTFTYTVGDGHGGATTTTVTITLDRAPTVVADSNADVEGATLTVSSAGSGVLANDSDRDGDTLTVSAISGGTVGVAKNTTYGQITLFADGTYTYVANNTSAIDAAPTGSHPIDTISFTVSDGHGGTTNETLSIALDRAPTAVGDTNSDLEGSTLSVLSAGSGVLANDSDKDGDTLTVSAITGGALGSAVNTTYGQITLNADGTYTYVANNTSAIDAAPTGSHAVDTINFTVSDGHGGTTNETLSITLDRAPTVTNDTNAVIEGGTLSVLSAISGVLGNDSDKDGDSLTVSAITGGLVGSAVNTTYGQITLNADGTYTYVANNTAAIDAAPTGSHAVDVINFTVSDGHGGTTNETLSITLDRDPTAVNDTGNITENGTLSVLSAGSGVLANDSDKDGDSLTVSAISGGLVGSSTVTTYGHITLNADGTYTYLADNTSAINAAPTGSHPIDTISFTVSDGHGGTTTETLNITIDRPAIGNNDSLNTTESSTATVGSGSPANANLLANDSDPDGDSFAITAVNGTALSGGLIHLTLASGALLTVNADGTYTYDPNHVFDYLAGSTSGASDTSATDSFTYTLTGGAVETVTITVNGQDSNDTLIGTTGNDTLTAGVGNDIVYDDNGLNSGKDPLDTSAGHSGGTDSINGGSGDDVVFMGGNLTAADHIDGSTGNDRVVLDGDYSAGLTFTATTMVNVENLGLVAGHSYDLVMDNATVAFGNTLRVQAGNFGAGDTVTFDASNDTTGGDYLINTGAGNDVLTGGAGGDRFHPGSGNDTIIGNGGDDKIGMNAFLNAADQIDGGEGHDSIVLKGDYSAGVVFTDTTMVNVELIGLVKGDSYSLTMADDTVALGDTLTVRAQSLGAGDNVTFDGSADVAGGAFIINTGDGNDVLTGGNGNDVFRPGAGNDTVHGGGGDDVINMANNLNAADQLDGGSGYNVLLLDGAYGSQLTLNSNTIANIQEIDFAAGHDYNLIFNGLDVANGASLTFRAGSLGVSDNLTLDGSAFGSGVTLIFNDGAGHDTLLGGGGNDIFRVGTGNDTINGGGGADLIKAGIGDDTFVYAAPSDSTSTNYDTIQGFDALNDHFQLLGYPVLAINAEVTHGVLNAATFDADLATAIGSGQLGAHDAVLYDPNHGDLHGHLFLVVDLNGVAGYQAGQDLVIDITGAANIGSLTTGNFIT